MITRLSEPYYVGGEAIAVGVSVGIAVASAPQGSADDLLKGADIALYEAKHAGRGVYRVFATGMDESAEERQRLRSELREAIAKGEFCIVYQPIVEFESTCVTGFEALLRWQHPRRGLLNPLEFIPLAEATGHILEIGAWVLRETCSMAATWPDELTVSVNLSPRQITDSDIKGTVSQALVASGLPAQRRQVIEAQRTEPHRIRLHCGLLSRPDFPVANSFGPVARGPLGRAPQIAAGHPGRSARKILGPQIEGPHHRQPGRASHSVDPVAPGLFGAVEPLGDLMRRPAAPQHQSRPPGQKLDARQIACNPRYRSQRQGPATPTKGRKCFRPGHLCPLHGRSGSSDITERAQ